MGNPLSYYTITFMERRDWLEGDDGEVGGRRGVTVGKENPSLIQESSLFLEILPHWDQVVVQDHLTVF